MNPLTVAASKPVRICPLLRSDDARLQTQLRVDYADIEGRSMGKYAYVPVETSVAQQMPDAARQRKVDELAVWRRLTAHTGRVTEADSRFVGRSQGI